jgi:hypothetical protein
LPATRSLIYNHTFTVDYSSQGWKAKSDTFTVPTGTDYTDGKYTLVLIADDQARVAIIDDVSLTVK